MHQQLSFIIQQAIEELNAIREDQVPIVFSPETPLYGQSSALDSVDLVNLLVTIEEKLQDELEIDFLIANEKALSMQNSPFKTIQTLHDYLTLELNLA